MRAPVRDPHSSWPGDWPSILADLSPARLIEFDTDDNGEVVGGGADFIVLGRIGTADSPVFDRRNGLGIAALCQDIIKTAPGPILGKGRPRIHIVMAATAKRPAILLIEGSHIAIGIYLGIGIRPRGSQRGRIGHGPVAGPW